MFTKIYSNIDVYKIYATEENQQPRFCSEGYPPYQEFLARGGVPNILIDESVIDILEIVDGVVQYKPDYQTTLLNKAKANKLAELASNRYNKEIGGLLVGTITVSTDRESQAMLHVACTRAEKGTITNPIKWKGASGWATIQPADIISVADAVTLFVEGLFEQEYNKAVLIEACTTIEEVNAVDVNF